MKNFQFQRGQSLVELLLAIGLTAILLPALLTGFVASREGKAQHGQRTQAVSFLKATVEAVRSVREKGWNNFATNGTFHPEISGSSWSLVAGSDTVGDFERRVDISNVNRGTCPGVDCGKIVTSGGVLDPSTKKIVAKLSWGPLYIYSTTSTFYITRYLGNNAFIQTTEANFNLGTKSSTIITNTSGGEVILGGCALNLPIATLDLPKSGVANALTAISTGGHAFAGTGENAAGVSFAKINISNPPSPTPPAASIDATFDGYKTNDVFGETNYAYLATDNHTKEIVIIDLNSIVSGKYQEVGFFNAPGLGSGESVFVSNDIGYMADGVNKLYSFDLRPASGGRSGSRPLLDPDGITLPGIGTEMVVVGSYAYLSIAGSSDDMRAVDVSNPANMSFAGFANVVSGGQGRDIFVNSTGTLAYLATSASPTEPEFFVLGTGAKGPTVNFPVLKLYEAGGMSPKGVTVINANDQYKAILVGTGGEEYQVLNLSTALPIITKCGGLNIDAGVNGVVSIIEADGDIYSYIITGDATTEFRIIEGGAASGTFESATFDAGSQAAFNRFDVSVNRPINTNIEFRVAVKQAISASCTGVTFTASDFVGPSGTPSDKFQTTLTAGIQAFNYVVPPIINPGQCFRYKAYLSTTDILATPVFYDITVNYSP